MKKIIKRLLPVIGGIIALLVQLFIKNNRKHMVPEHPYFTWFLLGAVLFFAGFLIASFFSAKSRYHLEKSGTFYFAAFLFITLLNVLVSKLAVFPAFLFPSLDKVFSIFFEKPLFLLGCVGSSFKLLGLGLLFGISLGFLTGVAMGFSKRFGYWANPIIKIIGPIPATAWIPLALQLLPAYGASVFVVALSVWFPVVLLTSSGIANIPNSYFEVGKTLGAGKFYQISRIGIPAAMPNIIQGIFFGVCSSFIALMPAEMYGAKAGIGWLISHGKENVDYTEVYSAIILTAIFCTVILNILFVVRGKILRWQKGLVKW